METRLFISIILIIWFAGANAFADQKGQFEIVSNSQEIFGDELSSLYNEIIAKDENIALEIQVPFIIAALISGMILTKNNST